MEWEEENIDLFTVFERTKILLKTYKKKISVNKLITKRFRWFAMIPVKCLKSNLELMNSVDL